MAEDFSMVWTRADLGVRRALELAHASLLAKGLAVGAVVVRRGGEILAEGRNRAYDAVGGSDALQRTPIAHAEMNALAGVDTDTDLTSMTLWSSHRPCAMCAAACAFLDIGTVRFVAPDPSDDDHSDPSGVDQRWIIVANLLFLTGIHTYSGGASPMLTAATQFEPEVIGLIGPPVLSDLYRPTLADSLLSLWPRVTFAAERRATRLGY